MHRIVKLITYRIVLGVLIGGGIVTPLKADERRFERTEPHMGTEFTISLYAPGDQQAEAALTAAFARIAALDQSLSHYRRDSELSQLVAAAPHSTGIPVSDDLWTVLSRSQELSRLTQGAFDVTVGPLSRMWRHARRQKQFPTKSRFEAARRLTGFSRMKLDEQHQAVRLERRGMRLDLGAIAKGYALDEALAVLRQQGISIALINGGGDLLVADPPPGKTGWRVGLSALSQGHPQEVIVIANQAIASSGDLNQFVVLDGVRYSHLIDPRTGMPLTMRSMVTVTAPTGMDADAMASIVSVLGPQQGLAFLEEQPQCEGRFASLTESTTASDQDQGQQGRLKILQTSAFPQAEMP